MQNAADHMAALCSALQVCVVCGGASVPRELPAAAVAVREEWLLQLAETHQGAADTRDYELARR